MDNMDWITVYGGIGFVTLIRVWICHELYRNKRVMKD